MKNTLYKNWRSNIYLFFPIYAIIIRKDLTDDQNQEMMRYLKSNYGGNILLKDYIIKLIKLSV